MLQPAEFQIRKWSHEQPQAKAHSLALWLGFVAFGATIALAMLPWGCWWVGVASAAAGLWTWSGVLLATKGRLRCPQCARRFRGLDRDADDQSRVTYRCPQCKVIWVTQWIDDPTTS